MFQGPRQQEARVQAPRGPPPCPSLRGLSLACWLDPDGRRPAWGCSPAWQGPAEGHSLGQADLPTFLSRCCPLRPLRCPPSAPSVLACAPGDALRWPPAVCVLTLTGRKGIAQRPRCCRWEKADPRTQDRPHPSLLVGQLSGLRLSFPPTPRWGLDHPARSASSPQGGNHAEPGATARLPGCPAARLIDSQAPAVREFTVGGELHGLSAHQGSIQRFSVVPTG